MDLSVIIVNFNVKYFLEQCLFSVVKASKNIDAEIFVVDNDSTDGSRGYLEKKFPHIIFKWRNSNDGFAKANNSVLAGAKGNYILFLNPDTIVPEDCFEKCLAFFKTHTNCGALGVHMIDGSGKFLKESKRSFPSASTSFYKMTGFTKLFPSSTIFAKYYAGHLNENQNHEVEVLAGAFMLLSKQVLEKVQGFDEDYFMYGEDIDLSYRIKKAGFRNYYFADTTIIHFKGESTQRRSREYVNTFYGAMKMFVSKHYKGKNIKLFLLNTSITLGKQLAGFRLLFKSKRNDSSSKPIQTAVVCSQQIFGSMIQLIRYSKTALQINGRIAVDKNDTVATLGNLSGIEKIIAKNSISQIIFCEDDLSFKSIIDKAKEHACKAAFLFHAKGSSSIVGSNNKNEKGVFIAKDQPVFLI